MYGGVNVLYMGGGTFTNDGTLTVSGFQTLELYGSAGVNAFVNNGTLTQQGSVTLIFVGTTAGVVFEQHWYGKRQCRHAAKIVAGGSNRRHLHTRARRSGTMSITGGTYTLQDGSSVTGTCTLQLSGGTLLVPGNVTVRPEIWPSAAAR